MGFPGRPQRPMWAHPNYRQPRPRREETAVEYTIRCIAHLVSPPQFAGEHYEIECTDMAEQILALQPQIEAAWQRSQSQEGEK